MLNNKNNSYTSFIRFLQYDNIVAHNSKVFSKFDFNPVSLEEIMESNVKQYSRSKL